MAHPWVQQRLALSTSIPSVGTQARSDMRYAAIVLPTLLSLCISAHALNYRSFSFYEGSFDQLRKEAFEGKQMTMEVIIPWMILKEDKEEIQ